ncbi:MAG: hypothetical protein J6X11_02275 [Treponema sp.]|nr:hypothetical protein [Treponema sp.]MBR4385805.1 hypothetical protein [Treponema sp.]
MAFGDDMIDGYAEGEEPLVFHHRRGEFRDLEDKRTRELAEGGGFKSKGFFGVLVGTKGNRMIFMALVVCMGLIFVLSILSGRKNEGVIDGVRCKMDAFSIAENVYVSVALDMTQAAKKKDDANRPRHIFADIKALDADGANVTSSQAECLFSLAEELSGDKKQKQFLRAVFTDYEVETVECTVFLADSNESETSDAKASKNSIQLKCKVSRH